VPKTTKRQVRQGLLGLTPRVLRCLQSYPVKPHMPRLTPQSLKKLTKNFATPDSPFTVASWLFEKLWKLWKAGK
jgi:hypothetical protein